MKTLMKPKVNNEGGDSNNEYVPKTPNMAQEDMPHLDEGGLISGSDFDVDTGDTDTLKAPAVNADVPPQNISDQSNAPPTTPQQPMAKPIVVPIQPAAQPKLPGMPAGIGPDDLQQYLGQQKQAIEKFGPEQQLDTEQALLKARQSPLAIAGNKMRGLSSDIMQGVARAGGTGAEKTGYDEQNALAGEVRDTMKEAQTGKMAQVQAEMKLSMDDPNSPLSKIAQKSESNTLQKLGWTPEQISSVSANTIGEATKNGLSYADTMAKLKLEGQIHEETSDIQKQSLGLRATENQMQHPIQSWLRNIGLGSQGGTTAPSSGPLGETTMKDGKTYQWSPSTGKYHLVQ